MEFLKKSNFILFKPKKIVRGDFYYVNKSERKTVFKLADCTGHGISGVFISMLGITYLNQVTENLEMHDPASALERLRKFVKGIFENSDSRNNGMDIALCDIDFETNKRLYSGINIPLYLACYHEIIEYKSTKNPTGNCLVVKKIKNIKAQV